ncbi:MAG: sterol desaturase family protein [Myxococcota bacterium]
MKLLPMIMLPVLALAVGLELRWARRNRRSVYNLKETLSNLFMMVVGNLLKPLSLVWTLFVLSGVERFQLFSIPLNFGGLLLTFIAAEFAYYWYHRLSHENSLFWAMHHVHHSSPWMNFTTALRLNWVAKFVAPIFFMPLVVLGMSPLVIAGSLAAGLLYQLFLHTESIGSLGRFEGKLLNTPSAHRVHHGSNPLYLDKNYGAVLILWDRLFGTYQAETEPVRYGVTTGFLGHNPLVAQFKPMVDYAERNNARG